MNDDVHLETAKAQIDYCKHMTTLSTGSIILLATFMEKLFANPCWKPLVVVSFIGFLLSVVSSVTQHTMYVLNGDAFARNVTDWRLTVATIAMIGIWIGFFVGVLSLGVFGIRNLI